MTTPLEVERDHCAFASRLLAVEVDAPLYRRLRAVPALIDPAIAALPEPRALDALATEFCRLFIGPGPVCPPYPGSGQFLGSHREAPFVRFLERHRLTESVPDNAPVLARHHLAIQLQVLAHLCDAELTGEAPGAARRARIELETQHLNRAIPDFARTLIANTDIAPYRTIGETLHALFSPRRVPASAS